VSWQTALGSPSIASIEQYLQKYQNGPHSTEAHSMLEGLHWTQDSQANSADSYRDYLSRYPDGQHAAAATEEIAFLDARQRRDPGLLESFLENYSSSRHSKEIRELRDDVIWELTDKNDEKSINAYLKEFSSGRHANEAHTRLAALTPRQIPHLPPTQIPQPPPLDDGKAIGVLLDQYKKAYEDLNINELTAVWPSAARQTFNDIRSASLSLRVLGSPDIQEDNATVNVSQSFKFRDTGGSEHKFDFRLAFRLRRSGDKNSPNGGWIIESIAKTK
jgi:hypothetical protein